MERIVVNTKSYSEAFRLLKRELEGRDVDLSKRHIVFVPDNFTLFVERLLFSDGGAFDISVGSFNRLFLQLVKVDVHLPRHGAVMLLKRVIDQNADKLKFFHKSARFKGFAEKMYDTVHLLARCAVLPQTLKESGTSGGKIDDIRLIYEEYLKASDGRFVDACGRMSLLAEAVKAADYSDATVYLAGFESLSNQELALVEALARRAKKTVIYETHECVPDFSSVQVEMFSCCDITDRLKAVAKRIRHFVKTEDADYGDMGLILPQELNSKAMRIMSEFGIPLYLDHKVNIGETRLAAYLEGLFKLSGRGFVYDDVIRFSKNYFLGVDKRHTDIFENYCLKYCIDYSKFFSPFKLIAERKEREESVGRSGFADSVTDEDIEYECVAEAVRKKIVSTSLEFRKFLKEEYKDGNFSGLVEFALKSCNAEELSEKLSAATGIDVTFVFEKIMSCAAVLDGICAGGYKITQLFEMFSEGLSSLNVSTIPKNRNAVAAGSANGFRAGGYKYIFVVDFSDGVTPQYANDCALITDTDIDRLHSGGIKIAPKISELNERNASNFFFAATEPQYLFLGYSKEGDRRISSASVNVKRTAAKIRWTCAETENAVLYADSELLTDVEKEQLCKICSVKGNALEMLLKSHGEKQEGSTGLSFASELAEAVGTENAEKFLKYEADGCGKKLNVKGIYFKKGTTSVTNLQDYFMCPQYNFLKNGLGIRERENGKLTALDVGTFIHKAVENFVKKFKEGNPRLQMTSVVEQLIKEDESRLYEANKGVIERACIDAVKISSNLANQIICSEFVPSYFEKRFPSDKKGGFSTVSFESGGRKILLTGSIDRADIWGDFVRIIDYKTGRPKSADFDFKKAYFGRQLQLLLYMCVMRENGFKAGGLFYFPCQTRWSDDCYSYRFSGLCNSSRDIAVAMDKNLALLDVKSEIINAKTRKNADKLTGESVLSGSCFFDGEQIDKLCDYAFIIAQNAVEEMESGFVDASPIDSSCTFCVYKTACPVSERNKTVRSSRSMTAEKILECFNECGNSDNCDNESNGDSDESINMQETDGVAYERN